MERLSHNTLGVTIFICHRENGDDMIVSVCAHNLKRLTLCLRSGRTDVPLPLGLRFMRVPLRFFETHSIL
ncbi:MAG: hypothetical protein LBF94_02465 [Puniceicoccales bacterium]|nr:hypothetical protein [Puniceicoccales bacterium]